MESTGCPSKLVSPSRTLSINKNSLGNKLVPEGENEHKSFDMVSPFTTSPLANRPGSVDKVFGNMEEISGNKALSLGPKVWALLNRLDLARFPVNQKFNSQDIITSTHYLPFCIPGTESGVVI